MRENNAFQLSLVGTQRRMPMAMERRKLEELNLVDNFLFGTMVTHPNLENHSLDIF
jgi:hypothetical protein